MSSPFAAAGVVAEAPVPPAGELAGRVVTTPFAEALASYDEAGLEAEAAGVLRAEFEDEQFLESLEALADEVAARHLTSAGTWAEADGHRLAEAEAEQWMETIAARADRLLAELEEHFGDRPAEPGAAAEIEAVAGFGTGWTPTGAQEQFLSGLLNKVKKVASGVGKLVSKGIGAVSKLLPLGKLFGVLRKLIRPLLERVLRKAIGKLPAASQPIATKVAAKLGIGGPADPPAAAGGDGESPWSAEALADEFDARLAEAVLAPNEAAADHLLAEYEADPRADALAGDGPLAELDRARERLARQLAEAEPGRPPLAEMEQFIPVVMAAMKLIKLGVKIIGRQKVVDFVAKLLAALIKDMVGPEAATQLSRHVADAGLRLLGLEAELGGRAADGTLGAEALVATAEDTVREVMALPAESLHNELLLEAAVQEAFAAAAVRHFPAGLLRADVVDAAGDGGNGIWILFPRAARGHYRYKKYSVVQPLVIGRPLARSVVYGDGETLEDRLLEAGVRSWPVQAEAHVYELLPGTEIGHLAAFEAAGEGVPVAEVAQEFEELLPSHRLPLPHARPDGRAGHPGDPGGHRRAGARVVRLRTHGARPRRRSPLGLRLDLGGAQPQLVVSLRVGERNAHLLAGHLAKRQHAEAVGLVRRLVGGPVREALAARLRRLAERRGLTLAEGTAAELAGRLAEGIGRVVAGQLPTAADALATAAKDPAAGLTLRFAFPFADRDAVGRGEPGEPAMTVHPGTHRD